MVAKKPLLSSNSELRKDSIWTWSIPAFATRLDDGRTVLTCPSAGACAKVCYARNGTFLFPVVQAAHKRNLTRILDDLDGWTLEMISELGAKKFRPSLKARTNVAPDLDRLDPWISLWAEVGGSAVRIHDSGDFFSDEYVLAWVNVARAVPDVLFYAYTKEVSRFRRLLGERGEKAPVNFRYLYSMGGKEDHLVDPDVDRHADVFPDSDAIVEAGYEDQSANDLYAITLPTTRVGIPSNNIPAFRKRLAGRTFAELEEDRRDVVR